MDFGIGSFGLSYLAGLLSTLSPCVLPLVPILVATAAAAHVLGPIALAIGLMSSFSLVGILLATLGGSLGLDQETFRTVAAAILVAFGVVLLSSRLQARFAYAASGLGAVGHQLLARFSLDGLGGQFVIGLLLGVLWSPCVGPTLGAATTLASQGRDLVQIGLLMMVFALGAGTPLVVLGSLSRSAAARLRGRMLAAGSVGKSILGGLLLLLGFAILADLERSFEAVLVRVSPAWLTTLTTRF